MAACTTDGSRDRSRRAGLGTVGTAAATLHVDETGVVVGEPLEIRTDSTHEAELTPKSGAGEETTTVPDGESTTTVRLCGRGEGAGEALAE